MQIKRGQKPGAGPQARIKNVYRNMDKLPTGMASDHVIRGCMVLEGGAFRGLYSQGALDAFMKHGLNMSATIGVSAGALAGMNYVAGQIGRSARANLGYRHDRDYIGTGALRKSRSLIRLDFLLEDFQDIEPLNLERFYDDRRRFVAVVTNCRTGQAEYKEKGICDEIMTAIKASASMPFVSPMVHLDGGEYLDGGCACKVPYEWALKEGFDKIIVIRTRHQAYRNKIEEKHTAARIYRHHPEFAARLDHSKEDYNRQCDELDALAASGRIFMLAPKEPVKIRRVEGNMHKLGRLYWQGYRDAVESIPAIKAYLSAR